jgi:hypothetical protein
MACVRSVCAALALSGILTAGVYHPLYATPAQRNTSQADGNKDTRGNPSAKVWVNTKSHVYHCPGTRYYGNTKSGEYMTQADAQKRGSRPANGKYCG